MTLERETQSLDAAADALSQDIIENAGPHVNLVKESPTCSSLAEHQEDTLLLEVVAFEYFLAAHAASRTQLEKQDELMSKIADKLWIYVSTRQSRLGRRLAFREFLDHRFNSYMTRTQEPDPLIRMAEALLENIFPLEPSSRDLLV